MERDSAGKIEKPAVVRFFCLGSFIKDGYLNITSNDMK